MTCINSSILESRNKDSVHHLHKPHMSDASSMLRAVMVIVLHQFQAVGTVLVDAQTAACVVSCVEAH